jgi:hypothetical protein
MDMRTRSVGAALAASLSFLGAVPAQAAARVFVSAFGNDAGDCSNRNTPCRTFAAGITQVDAGGEVIVIDTGSYGGATITKSVKLNVPVGVVAFTASTITVAAGASDVVVLRGLTLKALTPGTGNGILYTGGAALHVENCVIDGWQEGINVSTNAAVEVFVLDTVVRNTSDEGLFVGPVGDTPRVSVDNSRFENSGDCSVLVSQGDVTVMRSVATGSTEGFCANAAGAILNVESSIASNNAADGFIVFNGGVMRAARCTATGNGIGFLNQASTFESLGDNLVRGNSFANTSGTITIVAGQ